MFMQLRGYTGYKVEDGKYIGTGSYASMPSNATGGTQSDNLSGIPCTPPVVGGTAYPYLIKDTGSTIMLAPKSTSPGLIWGMRGPFSNYNGNESDDIICKNTEKFMMQGGTSICDTEAYYSYTPPEARPGDDVEYVSSSNSSAYPDFDVSGNHFYSLSGSDSIDPTAITYSKNDPKQGETITATITPSSNIYGGTIYYKYQYSANGGSSWVDAGTKTTETSQSFTVPANAVQFRVRVQASDNMGFTSTTYVTGANLTVTAPNSAPTAPASVSLPDRVSSEQSFTVTWEASTDAEGNLSGYQVERSYDRGTTWSTVSHSTTATSLTDQVAAGNQTMMYRVRAFDTEGLYSPWTTSEASTINTEPTAPAFVSVPDLVQFG